MILCHEMTSVSEAVGLQQIQAKCAALAPEAHVQTQLCCLLAVDPLASASSFIKGITAVLSHKALVRSNTILFDKVFHTFYVIKYFLKGQGTKKMENLG